MSDVLEQLRLSIANKLCGIESLLPKSYKLTLIARHTTQPDSDIIVTADDISAVMKSITTLYPEHKASDL